MHDTTTACWCGVENPYYEPLPATCGGSGHLDCECGGDLCVCHNHGGLDCDGCEECEDSGDWDGDGYEADDDGEEVTDATD